MALWHKYSSIAYLAVFIGVLGHASTEFFAVLSGVSGPELSVWRFLLGGAGLVVLSLLMPGTRDLVAPLRTHGWKLLFLSLLGVTIGYLVFHWSLDFASVPQVATLVTTIPIFVAISNLLINKAPITRGKIASGLCAVAGIALLITDGYVASLAGSGESLLGIFLATACAAAVAAYSVLVRPIITPRFAPACTDEMLAGLGRLAEETGTLVQTHCSESDWEHNYAFERFGTSDTEALDAFGLLREHTLLAHAKAALVEAGCTPRVVATDRQPGLGPLGGIATALQQTNHSRVMFVSCDMPFLTGELLTRFFGAAVPDPGALFTQHDRGMGFPFLLHRDDLKIVERQITKGALSLQRLAKRLAARAWEPPPELESQLFNINTPEDLAEARRRWKETMR